MRVFVQIIDTKTGIYQTGMIEEPVSKGFEISNALGHFGVNQSEIEWFPEKIFSETSFSLITFMSGKIINTSKVLSIVSVVYN